ncbi:winged helix-turn-helix domain-containing protein [Lysobacter enzymogenes]|uniref:nSTAND1 domain-containing NTPase n=1 Tax=Lysobacter enzymogenes TaxID=69 RepID=UPI001AF5D451|nr:winged helix-turn-helix domain-containing protein [Lysobacter enzymogenes]QQQ00639.1 winged helix-turn-helix domain-containing protein [Lysobacter enzymogenes]
MITPEPSHPAPEHFRIGDWIVYPKHNAIVRGEERVALEPRTMEALEFLAYHAGEVVPAERLLAECWPNIGVGDNPVHKVVAHLRKAFGDQAGAPRYIETIRKRGYRLIAPVVLPSGYRGAAAPAAPGWPHGSPFRGLDAFGAHDAGVFFGRDAAIASTLRALEAQWRSRTAFALLVGASGSGKTSLLRAGAAPRLAPPGTHALATLAVAQVPGRGPGAISFHAALAQALTRDMAPALLPGASQAEWLESLARSPEAAATQLRARLDAAAVRAGAPEHAVLALIVDQLEDFFAEGDDAAEQAHTVRTLAALARCGRVAVLAACRSSAYPALTEVPGLLALKHPDGHVDLAPPSAAEIAEMIRRPAQIAALSFESGDDGRLDDVLRDAAVAQPQCLPLLQHTLQQLYQRREQGGRLTFAAYRDIDGLDGALRQHAERAVAEVPAAAQRSLPRVLARLVRLSSSGERLGCLPAAMESFADPHERELIEALVRHRLLVDTVQDTRPAVIVAHEALLRAWPRAAAWLEESRDGLRLRARLAESAARWQSEGRRRDLLLPRGRRLDEARDLARRRPDLLDPAATTLIEHSVRRETRLTWLRRAAVGSVCALAAVAAAGGLLAHRARLQADQERARAQGLVEYMLGDLTERLERLGRLDLLDGAAQRILEDLRAPGQQSRDTRLNRSRVLRQIGKIRVARGAPDDARAALTESLALAAGLVEDSPASAEMLLNLGEASYWSGYLAFLRADYDTAQSHWQRYRRVAERAAALEPDRARAWIETSYALNTLGTLSRKRERHAEALALFERSEQYKRRALRFEPDDLRLRADLADSLSWSARTLDRLGRLDEAQRRYAQAIATIAQVRRQAPLDAEWMHREAILRSSDGQILASLQRTPDARAELEAAAALLDRIGGEQPERSDWTRDRLACRLSAAELELHDGRGAAARAHLEFADDALQALLAADASVQDLPRLRLRAALARARLEFADAGAKAARAPLAAAETLAGATADPTAPLAQKDRVLRAQLRMLRAQIARSDDPAGADLALAEAARWLGDPAGDDRETADARRRLDALSAAREAVAAAR